MMGDDIEDGVFIAMFVLAMCFLALVWASPASGQVPTYLGADVRRGDDVTIARMCAGESSPLRLDVCTAMTNVISRAAARRRISIGTQARAYSAVFRTARRPWLLELNARGTRPPSWPRASWSRYRPAWMHLLAHVRLVLAGEIEPACDDEPEHFGGTMDSHRMREWRQVCEHVDSGQLFWGRP